MNRIARLAASTCRAMAALALSTARADIYQWEYVNPADPSQGKQQSATLAPDGAGRSAQPSANLRFANLTMAYLNDADLTNADLSIANLTNAYLHQAKLANAILNNATLSGADLTAAHIAGASLIGATSRGLSATHLYSTASYQSHFLAGINLAFNNLSGWNFASQNLSSAAFSSSNLASADLNRAYLGSAVFTNANLTDADLSQANLTGANLRYATLTRADFTDADIRQASFARDATTLGRGITLAQIYSTSNYQAKDLSEIDFTNNDLSGGNFAEQRFASANLTSADLTNVNLNHADLSNAQVISAILERADLSGVNFANASLIGATLTDANLTGADVRGADLGYTAITLAQLYSTASYAARDLNRIGLGNVNLAGAKLASQNLGGGRLFSANLTGADLSQANLQGALVTSATLTDANLSQVSVGGSLFDFANLTNANLKQATIGNFSRFNSVNLTNANLTQANVSGTTFTGATLAGADLTDAVVRLASFSNTTSRGFAAAQLYSTGSYQEHDLAGIDVSGNDMSNWNFAGQNLTNAVLSGPLFFVGDPTHFSTLRDASFRDANLTNALCELADLTGADFSRANLTDASFNVATLTDADFTQAVIRGARFASSGITLAQLYSTASYADRNLSGINLAGINLTGVDFAGQDLATAFFQDAILSSSDLHDANLADSSFGGATLTNANFTGAKIRGADLGYSGVTLAQIYSTASYLAHDLAGIGLAGAALTSADLTGQDLSRSDLANATLTGADFRDANLFLADLGAANLTNASFRQANLAYAIFSFERCSLFGCSLEYAALAGADLTGADARGATGLNAANAITDNFIWPDGYIAGLDLDAGGLLVVRNIPGSPLKVDQHVAMDRGGTLRVEFDADAWGSTISFAPGITIALGGALELAFAADVNVASQVGRTFRLFDWMGVAPIGAFAVSSPYAWDLSRLYTTGEVTLTTIPEPATFALVAPGLLGLVVSVRRPPPRIDSFSKHREEFRAETRRRRKASLDRPSLRPLRLCASLFLIVVFACTVRADVYQWEYVNPADPSEGKRPSTTLAPGGAGVDASPSAQLHNRNLTMAYLIGADLTGAGAYNANLTNADLSQADLTSAFLQIATLSGARLLHANLTNANLAGATLTDADLTGAVIRGATFERFYDWNAGRNFGTELSLAQLYSTASYQARDLSGISLRYANLNGVDFAGQNLSGANLLYASLNGADLRGANLANANLSSAMLTGADFTGAEIRGATLYPYYEYSPGVYEAGITLAQFSSTATYQARDLSGITLANGHLNGWNFAGQNLTGASFNRSTLTGADFSGAVVRGANFAVYHYEYGSGTSINSYTQGTGVSPAQLYSTASYEARDLSGIDFTFNKLADVNLAGQTLSDANFNFATLTGADLRQASAVNANFAAAKLADANLSEANLTGAAFNGVNLTGVDFTGADVRGADFGTSYYWSSIYSYLTGTGITLPQLYSTVNYQARDLRGVILNGNNLAGGDFAGLNLENATLNSAILTDADFRGANLTNVNFSAAALTGADFRDANLAEAGFDGANLTGANFSGHVLANVNLTGATLADANFTDADVRGTNFTKSSYASEGTGISPDQLAATASYKAHDLSGIILRSNDLSGGNFVRQNLANSSFEWANLTGANFNQADLADASFEGATLAEANFSQANFTRTNLAYATLAGADLRQANLTSAKLTSASLAEADLSQADLTGASLDTATLTGADFHQAKLTNASLVGATITDADFSGADVRGADFSFTHYVINRWGWPIEIRLGTGVTLGQLYSTASYQAGDLSGTGFGNNDLSGGNFAGMNLANANFSSATLTDADFRDANLADAALYGANLSSADFTGADMTGASINSANLQATTSRGFTAAQLYSTASYQAHDLTGVALGSNTLSGWNLAEQNLSGASFANAVLTDADFAAAHVNGASFEKGETGTGLSLAQLYSTASYEARDLTGVNLTGNELAGGNFAGVNFSSATLSGADLRQADLASAALSGATLSGADLSLAHLASAALSRATLIGADLSGTDLANANLSAATLTGANFAGAEIRGARFDRVYTPTDCLNGVLSGSGIAPAQLYTTASYQAHDLSGVSLSGNDLAGVNFAGLNLTNVNLTGATLAGANFRQTNLTNVDLGGSLTDADFTDAEIRGASLYGITLEQLYSTASYQARDLTGIRASGDFTGGNFARQNLADADLSGATLTDADFTGAEVRGASFNGNYLYNNNTNSYTYVGIMSLAQLYSTASYQARDLTGINLRYANLAGGDFVGLNLANADLSGAMLTGADLADADVRGATFAPTYDYITQRNVGGLALEQLYATASYRARDLTGIVMAGDLERANFANQNLANAQFGGATLTEANFRGANLRKASLVSAELAGADFTGADIRGAALYGRFDYNRYRYVGGMSAEQLYSTVSYQAHDLSGVDLRSSDLSGWNFSGQSLANAIFGYSHTPYIICIGGVHYPQTETRYSTLAGADFTGADTRGAQYLTYITSWGAATANLIGPYGRIDGLDLDAGKLLVIRDYDGDPARGFGSIPITVDQRFVMGHEGVLRMVFEADAWDSTISFAAGIPVALGGTLELAFAADVNPTSQVGRTFKVFDWTGVTPTGAFTVSSPYAWNLSSLYATGEVTLTAVPEPPTFCLAVAMAYCGGRLRRRFRAASQTGKTRSASSGSETPHTRSTLKIATAMFALAAFAASARADIYQWEYVDPADPSQGKRQSATLARDGAGVNAAPGAPLFGRNLTKAYLIGADLTDAFGIATNLTDADLTQAKLANANFMLAALRGANFTGADVRGATFTPRLGFDALGNIYIVDGFTIAQLYSTASYQAHDLTAIGLSDLDLRGGNFAAQNLANAKFAGADLAGANFREANLANADLGRARLADVDFTDADVQGASFRSAAYTGFTLDQLYSTASYQARDLTGIELSENQLNGAHFAAQNLASAKFSFATLDDADFRDADLAGASFDQAYLTGADLTGAVVRGASFRRTRRFPDFPAFTLAQLYSTVSYRSRDLEGIDLSDNDLSGASFAGQNLADANFYLAALPDADFSNSELTDAHLGYATLTGADFRKANLASAKLFFAVLTDADFTGAEVRGANFGATMHIGFTLAQLYSTASYQAKDLSGVGLGSNNLAGGQFAGQNLAHADFYLATLTDVDFRGANLTGASFRNATLTGADFRQASLAYADFSNADLPGADFTAADVRGASFKATVFCDSFWGCYKVGTGLALAQLYSTASYHARDLSGIDFGLNDLAGVNFTGQNVANANFSDAALNGADFTAADARGAHLSSIPGNAITANLIRLDGHIDGLDLDDGGLLAVRDYDGDPARTSPIDGTPAPLPPIPITVDQRFAMAPGGALRLVFDADAWDSTISFAAGIPAALGGALELTFAGDVDVASQVGRTFHVFDWTGVNPAGAFAVVSPYAWDLTKLYATGKVTLTAVPESATFALAALGLLLGLVASVRRLPPRMGSCSKRREKLRAETPRRRGASLDRTSLRPLRLGVRALSAVMFTSATGWAQLPMTGAYVPEFQAVDALLQSFMANKPIPGGTITITLNDKVIYERGIGYSNAAKTVPMQETALMRLASLSKPITASAIHQLAKDGHLNLNDKVFNIDGNGGLLDVAPYNGVLGDSRLRDITVQHLLEHRGGWNRDTAGDLAFRDIQIANAMGVQSPPGILNTAKYILSRPLQFTPGADYNYSNVGYMFLGMLVETASGQPYESYVDEMVLGPAGIPTWEVDAGRTFAADQNPREPVYSAPSNTTQNVYDPTGLRVPWPYGGWDHERLIALGGLIASSKAMAMLAHDRIVFGPEIGKLRSDYTTSPEYWWYHGGSLDGTDTLVMGGMGVWGPDWKDATYSILFDRRPTTATSYSNDLALLLEPILEGIPTWPAPLVYAGDFTSDQWLTLDDISLFKQALALGSEAAFTEVYPTARYSAGDFDGDGLVNGFDAAGLVGALQHAGVPAQYVAQVLDSPGDFDLDSDVDGGDFLTWQRHPNIGNLADWQANFGTAATASMNVAVPEPAAMFLAPFALAAIPLIRGNRRLRARRASQVAACTFSIALFAPGAQADIYQWEYIDVSDPGQGKRQSTTFAPDGAGVDAVPGANFYARNLNMAYLIGADLTNVSGSVAHLTNADLSYANLTNANFYAATLTDTEFTGAEVRGANFDNGGSCGLFFCEPTGTGITLSQLYSTASHQAHDLTTGTGLSGNNLTGADFVGQNLSNALF